MSYKKESRQIIAAMPTSFTGAFVAGGAVTSVFTGAPINDVDLYFKSRGAFERAVFEAYDESLWCVSASKRAVTFAQGEQVVQLMHFDFFPTADDIFKAFDYTVVMGALDLDLVPRQQWDDATNRMVDLPDADACSGFRLHQEFLKHNAQRFLRFNPGTRYPIASAARVLKYQQRGYTIGKGDMMKIALAARSVQLESWEDLKDQIGGAYGEKVVLEQEGNEFTLTAAIEALTVESPEDTPWIKPDNDNMPGTAEALLEHIAKLKGEEYVPPALDETGWPVAA